jgi:hypothetical protein
MSYPIPVHHAPVYAVPKDPPYAGGAIPEPSKDHSVPAFSVPTFSVAGTPVFAPASTTVANPFPIWNRFPILNDEGLVHPGTTDALWEFGDRLFFPDRVIEGASICTALAAATLNKGETVQKVAQRLYENVGGVYPPDKHTIRALGKHLDVDIYITPFQWWHEDRDHNPLPVPGFNTLASKENPAIVYPIDGTPYESMKAPIAGKKRLIRLGRDGGNPDDDDESEYVYYYLIESAEETNKRNRRAGLIPNPSSSPSVLVSHTPQGTISEYPVPDLFPTYMDKAPEGHWFVPTVIGGETVYRLLPRGETSTDGVLRPFNT